MSGKLEIPQTRERFERMACNRCTSDWYCDAPCDFLEKTRKFDYKRLKQAYEDVDGDWQELHHRVMNWKPDYMTKSKKFVRRLLW